MPKFSISVSLGLFFTCISYFLYFAQGVGLFPHTAIDSVLHYTVFVPVEIAIYLHDEFLARLAGDAMPFMVIFLIASVIQIWVFYVLLWLVEWIEVLKQE